MLTNLICKMIIDLIEVLNKEEDPEPDPDPKVIILDPDLRCPKCNGSFGSGSGTLVFFLQNCLLNLDILDIRYYFSSPLPRYSVKAVTKLE